jgi:hypothetical protein
VPSAVRMDANRRKALQIQGLRQGLRQSRKRRAERRPMRKNAVRCPQWVRPVVQRPPHLSRCRSSTDRVRGLISRSLFRMVPQYCPHRSPCGEGQSGKPGQSRSSKPDSAAWPLPRPGRVAERACSEPSKAASNVQPVPGQSADRRRSVPASSRTCVLRNGSRRTPALPALQLRRARQRPANRP